MKKNILLLKEFEILSESLIKVPQKHRHTQTDQIQTTEELLIILVLQRY